MECEWSHDPTALPRRKKIPVLIEQTSGQTPEPGSKFWGREKSLPPPRGFVLMLNLVLWHFGCLSSARKTKSVIVSTLHSHVKTLRPVTCNYTHHVNEITYLGVRITWDGNHEPEIHDRINRGRAAITKLSSILWDRDVMVMWPPKQRLIFFMK